MSFNILNNRKPPECFGCRLYETGMGFAPPWGSGALGVMMVGEALGENEARQSRPFVESAQAGSLLERVLRNTGFDRNQFRIINTVNCRPPRDWLSGAPWEHDAVNHCKVHSLTAIRDFKPRVILALGAVALRMLTGQTGRARGISYLRGYVLPMLDTDIPVIGGFHPSYIRRGKQSLVNTLAHDIKKSVDIATGKYTRYCLHPEDEAYKYVTYITHPSVDEFKSYLFRAAENQGAIMSFDLEWGNSAFLEEDSDDEIQLEVDAGPITQAQFSLGPGEAIAVPWASPYKEIAIQMLGMPHTKAAHNGWRADMQVLARDHVKVNGVVHDTRWMWHHMQPDLPANLQFVCSFYGMPFAWKHLADSDEEFYGCADADGVSRIIHALPKQLQAKGIWDSYERHIVGIEPILIDMSRRGIPVNDEKRLALGEKLDKARIAKGEELQAYWPESLRKYTPKQGYVRPPKDKTGLIQREFPELKQEGQMEICETTVLRWCRVEPFNPGSWQQVLEYIKHKKHPVPKDKHGKETTAENELLKLAKKTKDPLYLGVLDYREYQKLKGTYVDGWAPGSDGCVHPSYNYGTAVGQLASKNPNGQNFPIRSDLAKEMREMIEAKDGYKLIEIDMSAFHAVTLAFEAKSINWLRLARSDIHSYTTAHFLKLEGRDKLLELPDDELKARLADIKKHYKDVRDNKAKHAILGVGNGLAYRGLYQRYWQYFENEKECKTLLDTIQGIFPEVFRYQNQRRQEAHQKTYLVSRWGFLRWFFDVMHYDYKTERMIRGDDSEKAVAFHHVNDAFGLMREIKLWAREREYDKKYGLCNTIHDSLIFHCQNEHADECIHTMYDYMSRRHRTLTNPGVADNGLWVDCEVKVGRNWKEIECVLKGKPKGLIDPGPDGEMVMPATKFDVEYFVPEHPPINLMGQRRSYAGQQFEMDFERGDVPDDIPF